MELVNLSVIIVSSIIMMVWAIRKRTEITTMTIEYIFSKDTDDLTKQQEKLREHMMYRDDQKSLETLAEYFQGITLASLRKLQRFLLLMTLVASICVWLLLEQKIVDYAQAVYFFIGSMSQIVIVLFIFRNYNFYDHRVIFLAR